MSLSKALVAIVAGSCLAAQLVIIIPPWGGVRFRYWPFVEYPMYSNAHYAGESFRLRELRVTPCDRPADPFVVDHEQLRLPMFRLWGMLDAVDNTSWWMSEETAAAEFDLLNRLIQTQLPPPVCLAQAWQKRYVIGEGGVEDRDPPWQLVAEWAPEAPERVRIHGVRL